MNAISAADEATYARGLAAGLAAARTFAQIDTHSMHAPAGSPPLFASAWRLGFAHVRAERAADRHMAERHGPILTGGDLLAAEAEHATMCTGRPAR